LLKGWLLANVNRTHTSPSDLESSDEASELLRRNKYTEQKYYVDRDEAEAE
jgi:hypothetical protein